MSEKKRYVIVADGEGAEACVIADGDLHEAAHKFMCLCGKPWEECDPSMIADIGLLDDESEWQKDEGGESFSVSWPHETGCITIYRITDPAPSQPEPSVTRCEVCGSQRIRQTGGRTEIADNKCHFAVPAAPQSTAARCSACMREGHTDHLDWLNHPELHEDGCACMECVKKLTPTPRADEEGRATEDCPRCEAPAAEPSVTEQSPAVRKAMQRFWKRLKEVKPGAAVPQATAAEPDTERDLTVHEEGDLMAILTGNPSAPPPAARLSDAEIAAKYAHAHIYTNGKWVEALTLDDCMAALAERGRQDEQIERELQNSKAPCGHLAQFCYTEDGGRHIICLVCERTALTAKVEELERERDIATIRKGQSEQERNYNFDQYKQWQFKALAAESKLATLKEALREHEWDSLTAHCNARGDFFNVCPACEWREDRGEHEPECWLAAALSAIEP